MNWQKGLKKMAWFLSCSTGLALAWWWILTWHPLWLADFLSSIAYFLEDSLPQPVIFGVLVMIVFLTGFTPIWILYFVAKSLVRGFADRPKQ